MPLKLNAPLILASASPRRRDLLRSAGFHFRIMPVRIKENVMIGERPVQYVRRLSRNKAMAVAQKMAHAWVLGADTIVVIDNTILGKPANKTQAKNMLKILSGREHIVLTGFTVVRGDTHTCLTKVVQSRVLFKPIQSWEMHWYVASQEPYDKAGGYAAQGRGACFIRSIRGSYTNVIGLPLCEVLETFETLHAIRVG